MLSTALARTLIGLLRHALKQPWRRVCARPAEPSAKSSTPSPSSDTAHTAWTHPGDRGCNVIVRRPRNAPARIPAAPSFPASKNSLEFVLCPAYSYVLVSTYIPTSSSRTPQERAEWRPQARLLPHRCRPPSSAWHDPDTSRRTRTSVLNALVLVRVGSDAAPLPGVAFELGGGGAWSTSAAGPRPRNARLQLIRELYDAARASDRRPDGGIERIVREDFKGLDPASRTRPAPPAPLSARSPIRSDTQRATAHTASQRSRARTQPCSNRANPEPASPMSGAEPRPRPLEPGRRRSRPRARVLVHVAPSAADGRASRDERGRAGRGRRCEQRVSAPAVIPSASPRLARPPRPTRTTALPSTAHAAPRACARPCANPSTRQPYNAQPDRPARSTPPRTLLAEDAHARGERASERPAADSYCTACVGEAGPLRTLQVRATVLHTIPPTLAALDLYVWSS
ncbi:hypothetical protein OH77DRAFT_1522628 [Trametes cingulata]|nr:hypothetical protein OH77DRAFT_1525869 [Trametes cingulata]KAI0353137.1 hypothetical protein OH77DRAFT_1522628 [Trametes cingulata]